MGEAANVFNSFSFGKWADLKKEEELDKESRRRRNAQIKRLKEQLAEERRLRELGGSGDGDLDLEALIEALQRGEEINEEDYDDEDPELDEYGDRTDDDILSEIHEYQRSHPGPPGATNGADDRFWKYNRRLIEEAPPMPATKSWKYNRAPEEKPTPPPPKPKEQPKEESHKFKYNRVVTR